MHEGGLNAEAFRFAIVASRWNELISARLVEGALDALKRFADMQQKYGTVLANKTPEVQEANLGDKGNFNKPYDKE